MINGECTCHYAMHLDVDWTFETSINDDQALCLDGQNFGNISRFLNHGCEDTSLIDMPIKIKNQIMQYYKVNSTQLYLSFMLVGIGTILTNFKLI
jgi:hypothetical protein